MKNTILKSIIIGFVFVLAGCAAQQHRATIENSPEAEELFYSGKVAPGYSYYYYGREQKPIALLALDAAYDVESKFWTRIDLSDAQLQEWTRRFSDKSNKIGREYRGKKIVSPQSDTIGLVLSEYYWITAWFEDPASNTVTIPPPDLLGTQPGAGSKWKANDQ